MKLRAALLLVCMISVPMVAMFSHKVSASTRQSLRRRLWDPIVDAAAESLGMAVAPPSDVRETVDTTGDAVETAGAALEPMPAMQPSPPGAPRADAPRTVTPMFQSRADGGSSGLGDAVADGSFPSPPVRGDPTDIASLEARLRALGATALEWTPAQGGDGQHRCRCRIPADPSGQLQRVFQASASDPVSALDSLVGQVSAWSMRTRSAGAGGPVVR